MDLERKEILIMSPISITLLLKIIDSFGLNVCGCNAVLEGGKRAEERGAAMVIKLRTTENALGIFK